MSSRILGMGDVLSLIEKAEEQVSEEEAEELQRKMSEGQFTLEDFLKQMRQIRKMGPIGNLLGMMPGMGAMKNLKDVDVDDGELDRVEAIILSMTPHERAMPQIIKGSRRRRIAEGSGTKIQQVNNLVKQFDQMKKLMKHMANGQMPDQNQMAKMMGQTQRPKIRRR
jgi:signal recognition particle subunit SRP54